MADDKAETPAPDTPASKLYLPDGVTEAKTVGQIKDDAKRHFTMEKVRAELVKQEKAKTDGKQSFDGIARIYAEKGFIFMIFTPEGRKKYGRDEKVFTVKEACKQAMAMNTMIPGLPMGKNQDTATEIKNDMMAAINEARDQIVDPGVATLHKVRGWTPDMEKAVRHKWLEHIAAREEEVKRRESRNL